MSDTPVFDSEQRRNEMWADLDELFNRYPELVERAGDALDGEIDNDGILFDPDSPRFIDGKVLILSVRNLQGWETSVVLEPIQQSTFMTHGLISAAEKTT